MPQPRALRANAAPLSDNEGPMATPLSKKVGSFFFAYESVAPNPNKADTPATLAKNAVAKKKMENTFKYQRLLGCRSKIALTIKKKNQKSTAIPKVTGLPIILDELCTQKKFRQKKNLI